MAPRTAKGAVAASRSSQRAKKAAAAKTAPAKKDTPPGGQRSLLDMWKKKVSSPKDRRIPVRDLSEALPREGSARKAYPHDARRAGTRVSPMRGKMSRQGDTRTSHCHKRFGAKETLNRHVRIHTGYKPHSCDYCGKRFIQSSQLRSHLFYHTGQSGTAEILRRMRSRFHPSRLPPPSHEEQTSRHVRGDSFRSGEKETPTTTSTAEASLVEGMEDRSELDDKGLTDAVRELLTLLVDEATLRGLGWPEAGVESILEAVIRRCGHEPAPVSTPHHDRLRHNIKLLFTVVIDDSAVKALLNNQTVDEQYLSVTIAIVMTLTPHLYQDRRPGLIRHYLSPSYVRYVHFHDHAEPLQILLLRKISIPLVVRRTLSFEYLPHLNNFSKALPMASTLPKVIDVSIWRIPVSKAYSMELSTRSVSNWKIYESEGLSGQSWAVPDQYPLTANKFKCDRANLLSSVSPGLPRTGPAEQILKWESHERLNPLPPNVAYDHRCWTRPPTAQTAGRRRFDCRIFAELRFAVAG
ncbi:unnamed protein product [Nesidiocoris tenuis]|uniref:C2H2-type domain-containing protein n=1 Tax=Nesidiocoris tenuis TaxID=355587 RepID=A0A6H5H455_9HEMI|nr:unnamed protein product [Nesidiocoris tenuis]